ncbi:MAG TPA: hypothetical protein VGJ88_02680, partial [Thermoanaerobaculia bacterium]
MQKAEGAQFCILHSAFCILHSAFCLRGPEVRVVSLLITNGRVVDPGILGSEEEMQNAEGRRQKELNSAFCIPPSAFCIPGPEVRVVSLLIT